MALLRRRRPARWVLPALVVGGVAAILLWKFVFGGLFGINLDTAVSGQTTLTLPAGFTANVFATGLDNPRFMAIGPDGTLFVAERGRNRIVALPDRNGDGRADEQITVASDLHAPSSLDFYQGTLIVGEEDQVSAITLDANQHQVARTVLVPQLPNNGLHTTKTVLVGPDGRLYVAMGSTCNVCQESDPRRAAVSVYPIAGGTGQVFSRGLRNAVGLAINPVSRAIWATTNGRDLWGDDRPPETVNVLQAGADFGWPRCHAGTLVDPDFGGSLGCQGVTPPVATMPAHMAPLALLFYQGSRFPAGYRDSLYIAFHGSWNSTRLVGYKVMRVPLAAGKVAGPAEDFATGWQVGNAGATGRPAGLAEGADGSLLVSDDKGGFIYRITASP
ncbi:MAG TPA: PQQ-dependent sugar dehydrogenase [Chloroflexia bacterium]|nr:PQQ-dependent sugar dehydrogenase [Chloroflexia bacterium]